MKGQFFNRALFFFFPLVILVVFACYRSQDPRLATHKKFLKELQAVVAQWAQKKYVPLTDRNSVKTELDHLQIIGPPLTAEMRGAYSDALINFFFAFKDGNIESWKQLRFDSLPGDLTPYGIFQVKFYYGLAKLDKDKSAYPDLAPRDRSFLAHWSQEINANVPPAISNDKDLDALFYKYLSEITYGKIYKDYFEGICLDEMIVKHDCYSSHPDSLTKYPFFPFTIQKVGAVDATFPNEGYTDWNNEGPTPSMFRVHPTLTELLSENGAVDCINAFVYIRIRETGEVAPFLLRHVWNPKNRRWALAEVVDAHLSSYNRVIRVIPL